MGFGFAASLADSVTDGDMALRRALELHMTTNFYPALPVAYAIVAEGALTAAAYGDWDAVVLLPAQLKVIPADRYLIETDSGEVGIQVQDAIRILQLDPFVTDWDA